jgi:putative ABC transport system permease protein
MLLTEIVRVAFASLRANKLRSLLTMLGIVIGVAAVIAMLALGNGAENAIKERIARLGTTVLQIQPQRVQQAGVATTTQAKLTTVDMAMVKERSPNVVDISYSQDKNLSVVWRNKNVSEQITGTTPNFMEVRGFKLAVGHMFTAADDNARRKVAVIGADVVPLIGALSPAALVDETIRIGGRQFTVVGVLAAKGATGFGDGDEQILIPFQTGRFEIFGYDRIQDAWALVSAEDSIPQAMAEIQSAIRRSHKLPLNSPNDFSIRNQADFLGVLNDTTATLTSLLAGIAAVSLLVGGIGIMNIMLVSVTERTREIGIRKALGATRRTILMQFLVEAVVLCVAGGAVGVGVGAMITTIIQRSLGWSTAMSLASVVLAFGFAAGVGMIFGVWPARRAAVLDPITALRYE